MSQTLIEGENAEFAMDDHEPALCLLPDSVMTLTETLQIDVCVRFLLEADAFLGKARRNNQIAFSSETGRIPGAKCQQ
jgi:hypothetical protein